MSDVNVALFVVGMMVAFWLSAAWFVYAVLRMVSRAWAMWRWRRSMVARDPYWEGLGSHPKTRRLRVRP